MKTNVPTHGYSGYMNRKTPCRCDVCVEETQLYHRTWMAKWRARQKNE